MEEFEIKFLEVDVPELEKKLLSIGAEKVGEYNYSRVMLDHPDFRMRDSHAWLRIRTDGKESTLTYKQRIGVKSNDASIPDEGMKEIEVVIDDYKKTYEIFKLSGFITKLEVKNKRVRYKKGDTVFDIDSYPQIPPYIEIESDSLVKAQEAARELGFDAEQGLICSGEQIYKKYGIDLNEYSHITFEGLIKR